jgi:predicted DNA-binding transcriptional regulator AlpA
MIDHNLGDNEVASVLKVSPQTLRNWRSQQKGPPYLKLGRAVRYQPEDLVEWMKNRKVKTEE